jgi:hypothetical protein
MSIRIGYSCPRCGNEISSQSKKGFTSLHTSVGIPLLACSKCNALIKTNHKPLEQLSRFDQILEWVKISLNILIIALIFGGMIGAMLGMAFNHFILKSTEPVNLYVVGLTIICLFYFKLNTYKKWFKKTSEFVNGNGDTISSDKYEHPDW